MTSHKQVVADFEGDLEVYREIKELKEAISELENESKGPFYRKHEYYIKIKIRKY